MCILGKTASRPFSRFFFVCDRASNVQCTCRVIKQLTEKHTFSFATYVYCVVTFRQRNIVVRRKKMKFLNNHCQTKEISSSLYTSANRDEVTFYRSEIKRVKISPRRGKNYSRKAEHSSLEPEYLPLIQLPRSLIQSTSLSAYFHNRLDSFFFLDQTVAIYVYRYY